MNINML